MEQEVRYAEQHVIQQALDEVEQSWTRQSRH
jgi:hypothetical protein